jgi:hypothetical protein
MLLELRRTHSGYKAPSCFLDVDVFLGRCLEPTVETMLFTELIQLLVIVIGNTILNLVTLKSK